MFRSRGRLLPRMSRASRIFHYGVLCARKHAPRDLLMLRYGGRDRFCAKKDGWMVGGTRICFKPRRPAWAGVAGFDAVTPPCAGRCCGGRQAGGQAHHARVDRPGCGASSNDRSRRGDSQVARVAHSLNPSGSEHLTEDRDGFRPLLGQLAPLTRSLYY